MVKTSLPLYKKIKHNILEKIENQTFAIGDTLPTELDFQKEFGVSRITVRHAISELVNEGYVTRTRGKGTTVIFKKLNENLTRFKSFTQEMLDLGLKAYTKTIFLSVVKAEKIVATNLEIKKNEYVLRIQRLRGTKDYPVVVFDSYFSLDRNLPLDKELYTGSLYDVIEKYCGFNYKKDLFRYADKFEAVLADEDLARQLEIDVGAPLLKRLSRTCDHNKKIFEFTICYYRGDKYSCAINYLE